MLHVFFWWQAVVFVQLHEPVSVKFLCMHPVQEVLVRAPHARSLVMLASVVLVLFMSQSQ